jgi:serine/threonine-protein kinase HipA
MAMKIGSKYKFTEVQVRHWEQFAQAAGLSPAQVKKRILTLARQLPAEAASLRSMFATRNLDHDILGEIVGLIERRCQLTCKRLEAAGPGGNE